jgi:hypothetical protein
MPTRLGLYALTLCFMLAGCGEEEVKESDCPDDGKKSADVEQFSALYAEAYCDLKSDCYPDTFAEEFGSLESCQRAVSRREIKKDCSGCVLDVDIGDECRDAAKSISCTGWVDDGALDSACDHRWDCSDAE